jgi:hypothetical protein
VIDINRFIGFLVLALVIYFIVTDPYAAAAIVQNIAYTLKEAGQAFATFFTAVV